jgi:polar amino acid transport system substrate-binding protein
MLQMILRRLAIASAVLIWTTRLVTADPADYGCDRPIHLAYYEFGVLYHAGVGIDSDVVEELAKRTGCVFQAETKPRADIWKELEAGTLDMTNSGIRTEARRRFAYFIPYLGWKNAVVATAAIASATQSFDDIVNNPEWHIGVVKGYAHGPYFDFRLEVAAAHGGVVEYPDQDSIYRALRSGEVQVAISPAVNYDFYLPTAEDRQNFVMLADTPAPANPHSMIFATARFTTSQINSWTRLFETMRLDGTLIRIYRAHLPARVATAILNY